MSELPNAILPGDIIAGILLRLPVKPICRFKCVSKPWQSFLSNSHFAKDHLKLHNNDPEDLISTSIQLNDYSPYILTLSAGKEFARKVQSELNVCSVVAGSCHGLVLLLLQDEPQYSRPNMILFNPITLETAKVVPLEADIYSYGFGYDSSSDDYKIVCLSKEFGKCVVDVYSVGMKCWKRTADSLLYCTSTSPFHGDYAPGVYLNGCIHWFGYHLSHVPTLLLLCYDLASNKFEEGLPPLSNVPFEVMVFEGCLALVYEPYWREMTIDVWVMREYGVRDSWTKFTTIDCSELILPVMPYNEEEIVAVRTSKKLLAYNRRTKICRDLVIDINRFGCPDDFQFYRVMPFRGSLLSPN